LLHTDLDVTSIALRTDDGDTFHRLRSIPGVGKMLALIFLYEIHDIHRFAEAATSPRIHTNSQQRG
jgi:hypothetical protein